MSESNGSSLQAFVSTVKKLHKVESVSDSIVVGIVPSTINFEALTQELDEKNILTSSDIEERTIEISKPVNYFQSLSDFLSSPKRRITCPKEFYLEDIDFLYGKRNEHIPEMIEKYFSACELFNVLLERCDHVDEEGSDRDVIFIGNVKVTITSIYDFEDLMELDFDSFSMLKVFLNPGPHQYEKTVIFTDTLNSFFPGKDSVSFGQIILKSKELISVCQKSFNLYIKEFSFDKIKSKFEKEKLDFTLKINAVFTGIQNQLLAIPFALLVSSIQFDPKDKFLFSNIAIWAAMIVFSMTLSFLIKNQKSALNAIKQEIDQQREDLVSKYPTEESYFSGLYDELVKRHAVQKRYFLIVELTVATILLGSLVYYLKL